MNDLILKLESATKHLYLTDGQRQALILAKHVAVHNQLDDPGAFYMAFARLTTHIGYTVVARIWGAFSGDIGTSPYYSRNIENCYLSYYIKRSNEWNGKSGVAKDELKFLEQILFLP